MRLKLCRLTRAVVKKKLIGQHNVINPSWEITEQHREQVTEEIIDSGSPKGKGKVGKAELR